MHTSLRQHELQQYLMETLTLACFYACSMPGAASMQAEAAQGRMLPRVQEDMQPWLQGIPDKYSFPALACMMCLPPVSSRNGMKDLQPLLLRNAGFVGEAQRLARCACSH